MGKSQSVPRARLSASLPAAAEPAPPQNASEQALVELHSQVMFEYPFLRDVYQSMLVTDARQRDNPIVYVNDRFEKMTLYAREEVLGRNCRFLQGAETDAAMVAAIRRAVAAGEQLLNIALLNYRKDGTPFVNHFSLLPVHLPQKRTGAVTHFLAIQRAIAVYRPQPPPMATTTTTKSAGFDLSDTSVDADDAIAIKFLSAADGTVQHLRLMSRRDLTLPALQAMCSDDCRLTVRDGSTKELLALESEKDLESAVEECAGGTLQVVLHASGADRTTSTMAPPADDAARSARPSGCKRSITQQTGDTDINAEMKDHGNHGDAANETDDDNDDDDSFWHQTDEGQDHNDSVGAGGEGNAVMVLQRLTKDALLALPSSPPITASAITTSSVLSSSSSSSSSFASDPSVEIWLDSLGLLEDYRQLFRLHRITAEDLTLVRESDLEQIGVDLVARQRMIAAIKAAEVLQRHRKKQATGRKR